MIRLAVIALALVGLGAVPGHVGPSRPELVGADSRAQALRFHLPLNANGLRGAELPTGFPVPDLVWDAAAPTVNSAPGAAETFALTGTVGSKGAPFCPTGRFDQVEENNGACLTTRYFTSNDRYVASSADLAEIGTTDRTVCASFRADAGSGETFLAATRSGSNDGWALDHDPANNRMQFIVYDGATFAVAQVNNLGALAGAWIFSCAVVDHDGGTFKVCNQGANCGTPVAMPNTPAAISNSAALRIGSQVDGSVGLVGDLVKLWSWPVALSDAQLTKLFHAYAGLLTSRQQTGTFTDNATSSCWIDGKLEEFNMHYPRIGCEVPPGETNAGLGDTGFFGASAETQVILHSRVLSSSWTASGAAVTGPTTTGSPWREGRGFYRVADDSGAAVEYIAQVRTDAAINTGDRMNVCIVAKADSAQTLDLQVVEATGCGGSTVNFNAIAIDTSWKRYRFTHTVADGACTAFEYRIAPTDFGSAAATGHADLLINVYRNASAGQYCPQYIETSAAAVTGENDALWYLASDVGIPSTWASSGTWRIQWRNVFVNPVVPDNGSMFMIDDDTAGPTNYMRFLYRNAGICGSFTGSAVGFLCTAVNPSTDADQLTTYWARFDDATDTHVARVDGASQVSATTALAGPTTIARLRVMTTQLESGAFFGGHIVTDVRIFR